MFYTDAIIVILDAEPGGGIQIPTISPSVEGSLRIALIAVPVLGTIVLWTVITFKLQRSRGKPIYP